MEFTWKSDIPTLGRPEYAPRSGRTIHIRVVEGENGLIVVVDGIDLDLLSEQVQSALDWWGQDVIRRLQENGL